MRQNHELLKEGLMTLVEYLQGIVSFSVRRQNWKTLFCPPNVYILIGHLYLHVYMHTHLHMHTCAGDINDK